MTIYGKCIAVNDRGEWYKDDRYWLQLSNKVGIVCSLYLSYPLVLGDYYTITITHDEGMN